MNIKRHAPAHRDWVFMVPESGTRRLELRFWTWMWRPWSIWPLPALGPERGNGGWLVGGGSVWFWWGMIWYDSPPTKTKTMETRFFAGMVIAPHIFWGNMETIFWGTWPKSDEWYPNYGYQKIGKLNEHEVFNQRMVWGSLFSDNALWIEMGPMGEVLPPWVMCLASHVGAQCQKLSQHHKASPNGRFIRFTTLVVL